MSFAICLWVRDTALDWKQEGIDLQKKTLSGVANQMLPQSTSNKMMKVGMETDGKVKESLEWLIN